MFSIFRIARFIHLIGLIGIGTLTTACAALPDVRYLGSSPAASAAPTVTDAQGTLSAKKSKSLLERRWRNSHLKVAALAALEEAVTGNPLIAGNKVTLLYDGPQTMAAMIESIGAAKDHINLETYIFDQDEVGLRFADLLIARQRDGVQVNVIYDSVGTIGTPQAFFDKMRDAGIRLLAFNPVNPLRLIAPWRPNNRDHRKILVVDGVVAYTGGVNISSTYANSSLFRTSAKRASNAVGWRDTHLKIEGPAVAALQWAFLNTWAGQQSPELPDSNFFPPLKDAGDKLVRILASAPGGDYEIYKAYILAIQQAKQTIHVTCAYFVPDTQSLQALSDAAKRGVDVKIILPGTTDSGLMHSATQSFYSEMLAAGIKIYQLKTSVLHAKTAVIDTVWATVGSTNIDTRSFLHNDEINVVVFSEEFAKAMESAFLEDLRQSVEITEEKWSQRGAGKRLKEWAARRLEYLL